MKMPRKKEVEEHYNKVAHTYDQRDLTYAHVRAQLLRLLPLGENQVTLDVGCGTGKILLELGRNSRYAVGVDISSAMLRGAIRKIKEFPNIDLVRCDVECLPFRKAVFDRITCTEVIEHLEAPMSLLNEMARTLKPDGEVFLTTPNDLWFPLFYIADKTGIRVPEGLANHFSPWRMRRLIDDSDLRVRYSKGTMFFPAKAWKFMEILSEVLNKLRLQNLCLKQIIVLRRGF